MANYVGVQCPVCEKKFVAEDDIVVCPICGAPHHRVCYEKLGKCALDDQHMKGHAWQHPHDSDRQAEAQGANANEMVCAICGSKNPLSGLFCQTCGARLGAQASSSTQHPPNGFGGGFTPPTINAYTMAFGGLSPTEEIEGVSVRDLAIFIGPSAHYFLPRFKLIAQKKGVVVNFASFFFSFFYFFYRKMYLAGAALLALILFSLFPLLMMMQEFIPFFVEHLPDILRGIDVMTLYHPQTNLWAYQIYPITQYIPLISTMIFAFGANRLYLSKALRVIHLARQEFQQTEDGAFNDHDYGLRLTRRGRVTFLPVVLLLLALILGYFALSFHYLMPYQEIISAAFNEVFGGS